MKLSENNSEILKAFFGASEEMPNLLLNKTNPFFNSKYADLTSIIDIIKPILVKHGLRIIQSGREKFLDTYLFHISGEYISFEGYPLTPLKSSPESIGAAMTYAKRQQIVAIFNLVADEDTDGDYSDRKTTKTESKLEEKTYRQKIIDKIGEIVKRNSFESTNIKANIARAKTDVEIEKVLADVLKLEKEQGVKTSTQGEIW